jgi:hypothetical protein
MSKALALNLQKSLTFAYDQAKTTLQGRVGLRTITDGNGPKSVLGVQPIINMDVFDDTGAGPGSMIAVTPNNRAFVGKSNTLEVFIISLYQLTTANGVTTASWVGDLKLNFGNLANTFTMKGLFIDDSNPASMTIVWAGTHNTAQNGGLFACWGVNVTDFYVAAPQTFPVASAANQTKATYMLSDAATQATHTMTVADGVGVNVATHHAYVLNGAAASPSIFKYDLSAPPSVVPGANGYTNSLFLLKTATLPALTGTVLLQNCVQVITPFGQPGAASSLNGNTCLSFITTTQIYACKTSDITSGASSIPSLVSADNAAGTDYVTANLSYGQFNQEVGKWIAITVNGNCLIKQLVNLDPNAKYFGVFNNIRTESGGSLTPEFGAITNACLACGNGWAIMSNSSTGQRGLLALDVMSDENSIDSNGERYASIISPVISGNFTQGVHLALLKQLAKRSVYPTIQYRTSNFNVGPGVGFDATWTTAPKDGDLSALVNATQVQFRILASSVGTTNSNTSQIQEAFFIYSDATQISSNWEGSVDNTSQSSASPMYVAFRQRAAYSPLPTKFVIKGVDDSGNVIYTFDTVANPSVFSQSANNGGSWAAWTNMGSFPNVAGTTELRVLVASPSGTRLTWSIQEV